MDNDSNCSLLYLATSSLIKTKVTLDKDKVVYALYVRYGVVCHRNVLVDSIFVLILFTKSEAEFVAHYITYIYQ